MFGRKREAELENKLNEYKSRAGSLEGEINDHLDRMDSEITVIEEDVKALGDGHENMGRDLAYAEAITEKLIKELEKTGEEIGKKEDYSRRMREALGERDEFDVDCITRNADRISDEIRNNDRKINSIIEEIRGVELLSTKMKDIAGQTSALSLNAAIMGARIDSGEEGFVQTATEIKELAAEYSRIISDLNRRTERMLGVINELTASNSEMRTLSSEGSDVAREFSDKYEGLYKEYGKKSWEREEARTDLSASLEDMRAVSKSISDAIGTGKDAAEDLRKISDKIHTQKESVKTAAGIIAKIDKIM